MASAEWLNLISSVDPAILSSRGDAILDPAINPSSLPPPQVLQAVAEPIRVLVADDEPLSRRKMADTLTAWGYEVDTAANGTAALVALSRTDGPRMAVLDWEMPGMSGIDVCRMIRARTDRAYVYTVLVTSRDNRRHLIDGLAAGADDYLRKPVDEQELEVRIRAGRRIVQLQNQLLAAQFQLEHRALHDALTGALNRGALMDHLARELDRARRRQHSLVAILLDVDFFKKVNDTHGHLAGDAVLKAVARTGAKMVRSYDTFGRYGGEEFLIIAPECSLEDGLEVAERVREAIAAITVHHEETALSVTASFGVAATRGDASLEQLLDAADTALYAAKEAGRNRVLSASTADSSRAPQSTLHPLGETLRARSE